MSTPENRADAIGPVAALARWWWLALVLIVVGGAAGIAGAKVAATQYTAETRLVVGSDDLSAYEVPGFASASQQLASNYARYVDSTSTVSQSLRKALGSRDSDLVSISASPIAQSAVVSVQVVATSRSTAVDAADAVAKLLVAQTSTSDSLKQSSLLKQYQALTAKTVAATTRVTRLTRDLDQAQEDKKPTASLEQQLEQAKIASDGLVLQQTALGVKYQTAVNDPPSQSQLNVIEKAAVSSDDSTRRLQIYLVAGIVGGLVLALLIANVLERRRSARAFRAAR